MCESQDILDRTCFQVGMEKDKMKSLRNDEKHLLWIRNCQQSCGRALDPEISWAASRYNPYDKDISYCWTRLSTYVPIETVFLGSATVNESIKKERYVLHISGKISIGHCLIAIVITKKLEIFYKVIFERFASCSLLHYSNKEIYQSGLIKNRVCRISSFWNVQYIWNNTILVSLRRTVESNEIASIAELLV